jgi:hypothetical protein
MIRKLKTTLLSRPLAILTTGLTTLTVSAMAESIPPVVEALHQDVWNRFVLKPQGLLLDYTNLDGTVEIPNAEECREGKPNALSWWTPIENGAFFNGLYIDGILHRWKLTGKEEDLEKARLLMEGLMLCSSVGNAPGFVARAVLEDKSSHYAMGSDDQTGPWLYGLWRYLRSGAATDEEKKRIVAKLVEVVSALEANRWLMPCDPIGDVKPGQFRGGWGGADFRGASRMLFAARALFELTGDAHWMDVYEQAVSETFKNGQTRLQLVAEGMPGEWRAHPNLSKSHLYIYVVSQAMIRDLMQMEADPARKKAYEASLKATAEAALADISTNLHPDFGKAEFKTNWRVMNDLWKPQSTPEEAVSLAIPQLTAWKNHGREVEIAALREPLSAIWMAALHPDGRPEETELWRELVSKVDWKMVYSSFGYMGESVAYLLQSEKDRPVRPASASVRTPEVTAAGSNGAVSKAVLDDKATRCTDLFAFTEIPNELAGGTIYTIPRGSNAAPGLGFVVKPAAGSTAWLLIMDKGDEETPEGWNETGLVSRWEINGASFADRVYRRSISQGETIVVPPASAQTGGIFSIPHAVVIGTN